jgi:hypothetical protein
MAKTSEEEGEATMTIRPAVRLMTTIYPSMSHESIMQNLVFSKMSAIDELEQRPTIEFVEFLEYLCRVALKAHPEKQRLDEAVAALLDKLFFRQGYKRTQSV